jgi:hypothetical protein
LDAILISLRGQFGQNVGTILGENNVHFGKKKMGAILDECGMVWGTVGIGKSGGLKRDFEKLEISAFISSFFDSIFI